MAISRILDEIIKYNGPSCCCVVVSTIWFKHYCLFHSLLLLLEKSTKLTFEIAFQNAHCTNNKTNVTVSMGVVLLISLGVFVVYSILELVKYTQQGVGLKQIKTEHLRSITKITPKLHISERSRKNDPHYFTTLGRGGITLTLILRKL